MVKNSTKPTPPAEPLSYASPETWVYVASRLKDDPNLPVNIPADIWLTHRKATEPKPRRLVLKFSLAVAGVACLLQYCLASDSLSSGIYQNIMKTYFGSEGQACFLLLDDIPKYFKSDVASDLFAAPRDCNRCSGVRDVPVMSELTPDRFHEVFWGTPDQGHMGAGQPIVVTDATQGWSALETFTPEYFLKMFSSPLAVAASSESADCQFFGYETKFDNMADMMEQVVAGNLSPPWYVGWSSCEFNTRAEFRRHYERPYFLSEHSRHSGLDWLFLGSPGHGANMHVDDVGRPSWQAQIKGFKQWDLAPPYECRDVCRPLTAVLRPGDMLVFDSDFWYHKTKVLYDDISIAIGAEFD